MALENFPVYSGDELQKLRKGKGWSIQQLSDVSGVSSGAIWNFEKEKRHPQTDVLKKLLNALGTRMLV